MDSRPIGVFDSGLGGLTAVRELRNVLPHEHIVYFGDTARVPYGTRSPETIRRFSAQDLRFLLRLNPKAILVACGTISSTALDYLKQLSPVPILGIVEPTVRAALAATRNGKIGVLGTSATVASGLYERLLLSSDASVAVVNQACPLFVPLVENGCYSAEDPIVQLAVVRYIAPLRDAEVDTVILGCTHYPFLRDALQRAFGDGVTLIDSGREGARMLSDLLREENSLNTEGTGQFDCYVTDRTMHFIGVAESFLSLDIAAHVHEISVEE